MTDTGAKPLEMAFLVPEERADEIIFMIDNILSKSKEELKEFGYNMEEYTV